LINLVGNALKFTHEGYVLLKLETENRDGTAHLKTSVIDTGIGIPLDKAAIIFDKFAQIDTSSTRKYGGTGLGLAISSNLARGMGGELRLDTNGGQGSIFWFALDMPIIKQGSNFSDRPLSEMIRLPILVVSADTDCLAKIKQNVQDLSGKAVCVKSETNAIDILKFMSNKKATFPLTIVDGTLPGKVAASIVNHIRNDPLMRSIPILVLIGPSADADLAGADKIISKTFTPDELKRDVYALIMEGQTRQLIELETGKPNDKTSGPGSQDNQSSFDQIRSTAA
ncbi:MAG: hypothetical protein EX271_08115, partial [Acidimicrobiales bacterium]